MSTTMLYMLPQLILLAFPCTEVVLFNIVLRWRARLIEREKKEGGEQKERERERREAELRKEHEELIRGWQERREDHKAHYVGVVAQRHEQEGRIALELLLNHAQQQRGRFISFISVRRQQAQLRLSLEALKAAEQGVKERLEKGFEEARNISGVSKLMVACDGTFVVVTEPVEIRHEGASYNLGTFEIRVATNGLFSIKGSHPNICSQSGMCMMKPQMLAAMAKYIADYQLAEALTLLIGFLRSYDPETAEKRIEEFAGKGGGGGGGEERKRDECAAAENRAPA